MTKKINSIEFCIIFYFIIRSTSLGMAMNTYIHIGNTLGYLSPIIGLIIGFIPLYIFFKLFNYEPNLNIFEKIDKIFNKKIGFIINLLITLFIFFLVNIIFWNLLNFIGSQYLYKTPNIYIGIIFGICFYYICSKKIEVTFKVANILFFISILIFIICVLGLIPHFNYNNLLPITKNYNRLFISSLSHVSFSILPLFIVLMIPKNKIKKDDNSTKKLIIIYILANIGKAIVCFLTISIFGIELAKLYEYPDFAVLRKISTTGFFQRYESILATQWIFDLFIMITMCFNFIKLYIIHYNKYSNIKMLIIILVSCIVSGKYIFKSNIVGEKFIMNILPSITYIFLFIIPIIIYLKIKKQSN